MMYDVCVIGGGPAGIFSSYYASSRSLKTILVEADSKLGGRLNYYLQMPLYDVPGEFGTKTHELLNSYVAQLYKSDATILLNTAVLEIKKQETYFTVQTLNNFIEAKAIIVATGNGTIQNKKLKTTKANEDTLKHICYEVKDEFKTYKKVAIIGHTPMAIDWAIQFAQKGVHVSLYETKPLQLQPLLMNQLTVLPIERIPFNTVNEMYFDQGLFKMDEATYENVYAHIGTTKQSISFAEKLMSLDNGMTSIKGLFIAGDARNERGKLKLIHGATHDAMQAVNEANQYLNKEDYYQPIVSTHHPIFKHSGEMKKDLRYVCYTYMKEKSNKVDYEVLCDALAVTVGKVLPYLMKEEEQVLKSDLLKIVELVYHANGSVRGMLAITEEDLQWLSDKYDEYCAYVGDTMKQFMLPIGCHAALQLHEVRNDAKLVYRMLHHVNKEDDVNVNPIVFKFIGLLSNVACAMAFYANQINDVEEIPFHTKSYILK